MAKNGVDDIMMTKDRDKEKKKTLLRRPQITWAQGREMMMMIVPCLSARLSLSFTAKHAELTSEAECVRSLFLSECFVYNYFVPHV